NNTITGNKIYNCGGYGITESESTGNKISGNTLSWNREDVELTVLLVVIGTAVVVTGSGVIIWKKRKR
ncbi:MAG: NosD domain-containing protein, partial [Candidatus Odinarchaeota archaeon]